MPAGDAPDPADAAAWRERRTAGAQGRADALARRKAAEHDEARRLLREFVAEVTARGISPGPLRARAYHGSATYRTRVSGWYVRRNGTLAVGTDGELYTLTVPSSLKGRLTGVEVSPTDPPLVVGAGGRDGESIALADLLRMRLDAGRDWP